MFTPLLQSSPRLQGPTRPEPSHLSEFISYHSSITEKKNSQPSLKLILVSGLLHVLGAAPNPTLPTTPKRVSDSLYIKASTTSSTRLSLTTQSKTHSVTPTTLASIKIKAL